MQAAGAVGIDQGGARVGLGELANRGVVHMGVVPEVLRGSVIYSLDMGSLIAGTR